MSLSIITDSDEASFQPHVLLISSSVRIPRGQERGVRGVVGFIKEMTYLGFDFRDEGHNLDRPDHVPQVCESSLTDVW